MNLQALIAPYVAAINPTIVVTVTPAAGGYAIAADGTILARAVGESLPDSYYFAIAFLDTVGFFDPGKRFWTDRSFPQAEALRTRLEDRVRALHPNDPMVPLALARLQR